VAQHARAADRFAHEIVCILTALPALAAADGQAVGRHSVSTSRIGLVPLEPDGERLVAYLERRTPWES
jgi:hypothetical protein